MYDLQPKSEPAPALTNRKPALRNNSNQPAQPIIKDQKLLALYKVMDMGA